MKELWKVFYLHGKEICRYTIRGTFEGEEEDTIALLAYEKNVPREEITVRIENR